MIYLGLEVEKKEQHEPIFIEILEYDNIECVLSKIVVPFLECVKKLGALDIYSGHEKIPFEKRDPLYKSIL